MTVVGPRAVGALLLLATLGVAAPAARADGEPEIRRSQVVKSVERVRPALVSIRTTQLVTQRWFDDDLALREEPLEVEGSLGSGVVFHPAGFVITNAHVISRASNLYVHLSGEERGDGRRAVPFAVDLANDLAILRIVPQDGARGQRFAYLPLGRSNDLMLGESVIAVGNPFKLGLSVSTGVIAGLDRTLSLGRRRFDDFIQVDAAINPGNSGGALLDVTGRWIGVTTAIYRRVSGAEGIGFAIPADRVRRLVGTAFKRRVLTGEWLGIDEGEGPAGEPVVKQVFARGPAGPAGLRKGDVIASVNGLATPTLHDYALTLLNAPTGGVVRLGILREGSALPQPLAVQLLPVPTDELSLEHLGMQCADVADYEAGVVVRAVRPEGPAAKIGLRVGDVVIGLGAGQNLWQIRNTDDLLIFLQNVAPGDLVEVTARRPAPEGSPTLPRALTGRMRAE
jgi:serine protease Do